jgi:hypothetical protein
MTEFSFYPKSKSNKRTTNSKKRATRSSESESGEEDSEKERRPRDTGLYESDSRIQEGKRPSSEFYVVNEKKRKIKKYEEKRMKKKKEKYKKLKTSYKELVKENIKIRERKGAWRKACKKGDVLINSFKEAADVKKFKNQNFFNPLTSSMQKWP